MRRSYSFLVAASGLVLFALSCFPASPRANPIPDGTVLAHVAAPDPMVCEGGVVTTCEEVVQYTHQEGLLEFTLFAYFPIWVDVRSVDVYVHWPQDWVFLEGEVCHADTGTLDAGTDLAHVHAEWDSYYPAGLLPFARLRLDVSGEGTLAGEGIASMNYGGEWETTMLWPGGAMAGIECGYTYTRCGEYYPAPCLPTLEPESLTFVLPRGQSGQQVISAYSHISAECATEFERLGDWMDLEVTDLGSHHYEVLVTVDTTGMEVGEYQGWVRGIALAAACTEVTLIVEPAAQEIPDDWGPSEEPASSSWGELKSRYR